MQEAPQEQSDHGQSPVGGAGVGFVVGSSFFSSAALPPNSLPHIVDSYSSNEKFDRTIY